MVRKSFAANRLPHFSIPTTSLQLFSFFSTSSIHSSMWHSGSSSLMNGTLETHGYCATECSFKKECLCLENKLENLIISVDSDAHCIMELQLVRSFGNSNQSGTCEIVRPYNMGVFSRCLSHDRVTTTIYIYITVSETGQADTHTQ